MERTMPYKLKKKDNKCKVTSTNHPNGFSRKWLPCDKAKKQLAALHINTKESFERKLDKILKEETSEKITPKDIYSFYLATVLYQSDDIKNDKPALYVIHELMSSLKAKYIAEFRELIAKQLTKYHSRNRLDKGVYNISDLSNANPTDMHKYMKSTYRSDMKRRNDVWESLTYHLSMLYKSNSLKHVIMYIDRINNDVHNTDENTISKLEDGYKLWDHLTEALDHVHKSRPRQLIKGSYSDIRNIAREYLYLL